MSDLPILGNVDAVSANTRAEQERVAAAAEARVPEKELRMVLSMLFQPARPGLLAVDGHRKSRGGRC